MLRLLPVFAVLTVAACVGPGAQVVTIDGREIRVEPDRSSQTAYFAAHLPGQGALADGATRYARNARAVEAVTGCAVDPVTARNDLYGGSTFAVAC